MFRKSLFALAALAAMAFGAPVGASAGHGQLSRRSPWPPRPRSSRQAVTTAAAITAHGHYGGGYWRPWLLRSGAMATARTTAAVTRRATARLRLRLRARLLRRLGLQRLRLDSELECPRATAAPPFRTSPQCGKRAVRRRTAEASTDVDIAEGGLVTV